MIKKTDELKLLLLMGRKILSREKYSKIKKIKNEMDKIDLLKYSIVNFFYEEMEENKRKIKELEEKGQDVFFLKTKLELLPIKIRHFKIEHNPRDFYNLISLIDNIKKEFRHV